MTELFDVLADQTRRDILQILLVRSAQGEAEASVSELVEALGVSQPTVSKQLKVLREADLVHVRTEGQRRYYWLNAGPLAEVGSWLSRFTGSLNEAVDEAKESFTEQTLPELDRRVAGAARKLGALAADVKDRSQRTVDAVCTAGSAAVDTATHAAETVRLAVDRAVVQPIRSAMHRDQ